MHYKIFFPLFSILLTQITYTENWYALSPGIEPGRTAPEADALSIELGEPVSCIWYISEEPDTCQDYLR